MDCFGAVVFVFAVLVVNDLAAAAYMRSRRDPAPCPADVEEA